MGIKDNIRELYGDEIKELTNLSKEAKEELKKESKDFIVELNENRREIKNRHISYYRRKKVIDILIYISLGATPILTGLLIYMLLNN